jgi:type I restriction enzyme, S subunit
MKPCYKQTEVGVIPEEWTVHPLRNFLSSSPDYGINAPAVPFSDKLPAYIRITDITENGRFCTEKPVSVKCAEADHYYLREGDLVFARTGASVGKSYLYSPKDGKLVFAGFLIRVTPNPAKLVPEYLAGYVSTGIYWNWVRLMSMRSGQPGINGREYGQLPIPLPPTLAEQRTIASALSDADALIESLERLIAKKRDIKQGAMQELLTGKKRLPGFTGKWERKRLGEICEIAMGRTPPRLNPVYWGHGYKWLSIADLQSKVVSESKEEISELAASGMNIIRKGTLLMSFKLSLGRLCFAGCDLFTNEAICSFNKLQDDAEFLYYALGKTDFSLYGKQAVKGYTLNKESLKIVEVWLPSKKSEQTAIAEVLSDMDAEIAALEEKLTKARAIKQGMMQELLTGRIRLV